MISILSYGCTSAAGRGVESFWRGLREGRDHSKELITSKWPVVPPGLARACVWPQEEVKRPVQVSLTNELLSVWKEAWGVQPAPVELGVIFASTKGCLEDFIWQPSAEALARDPLTPCLESFLERAGLHPKKSLCVSNACASSHSAIYLAADWLRRGRVSHVLVLAGDRIGPFVYNGFHALKALSEGPGPIRPFSAERDGLRLGEAVGAMVFSREPSSLSLEGIEIDTEGFAATRPSDAGKSLERAVLRAAGLEVPDLIIAHGTGTIANDRIEDQVLGGLYKDSMITATKWSIGHTLGTSGMMDLIAACESLRRQESFCIATTDKIDPEFKGHYLHAGVSGPRTFATALVTSLGFGGVHAAARVAWRGRRQSS